MSEIHHAAQLVQLALENELDQLAIHPDAHPPGLQRELTQPPVVGEPPPPHPFFSPDWEVEGSPVGQGGAEAWVLWRSSTRRRFVDLYFPAFDDSTRLVEAANGRELAEALRLFRDSLQEPGGRGFAYRISPGHTGGRLIPNGTWQECFGEPRAPELAHDGGLTQRFYWLRNLTDAEQALAFVHAFDINAQYLGVCSNLHVGIGNYDHLEGAVAGAACKAHRTRMGKWLLIPPPGYFRTAEPLRASEGQLDPFDPNPSHVAREHWYSAPMIELAAEWGLKFEVIEAYVYRNQTRGLRRFHALCTTARQRLSEDKTPAAKLALGLLKDVYAVTLGGWLIRSTVSPEQRWPHWRHAVIAKATANMARAVRRAGVDPFAASKDTIYIASTTEDPALTAGGLTLSRQPGKWKPTGCWPMAAALAAIEQAGIGGLDDLERPGA